MAARLCEPGQAAAIVGLGAMLSDRRGPVERFVIFTCGRACAGACAGLAAMAVPSPATDAGLGHLFAVACAAATAASAVEFCVTAFTLWLRHRSSIVELWRQVRVHALITVSLCAPVGGPLRLRLPRLGHLGARVLRDPGGRQPASRSACTPPRST